MPFKNASASDIILPNVWLFLMENMYFCHEVYLVYLFSLTNHPLLSVVSSYPPSVL
jgi:hypothetical protein